MSLTARQVRAQLVRAVEAAGGRASYGRAHGMSPAYVGAVCSGKRTLGPLVLAALGLERVVIYRRRK